MVLPTILVEDALTQLHADPLSGHLGVDKTTGRVLERYYWAGYTKDVEVYVRSCDTCQRRKHTNPAPKANLQSIPVGAPFEMIAMDFPELPRTNRGNKYILVITDYFTRWPEVFAVPDQRSASVAQDLVDGIVTRHGVPMVIHSDQGRNFEISTIKELARILGMTKVRTSPYHSQGDGLVERLNRSLIDILAKYCSRCPRDWDIRRGSRGALAGGHGIRGRVSSDALHISTL